MTFKRTIETFRDIDYLEELVCNNQAISPGSLSLLLLTKLAYYTLTLSQSTSLKYVKKGLLEADKSDNKYMKLFFLFLKTKLFFHKGEYKKAKEILNQTVKSSELQKYPFLLGTYYSLESDYYFEGNLDTSIKYLQKSLKVFQEINNLKGVFWAKFNLHSAYLNNGAPEQAEKLLKELLNTHEYKQQIRYQAKLENNLGVIKYYQNDIDSAIAAFTRAHQIAVQCNELHLQQRLLGNIATMYILQGRYKEALNILKTLLKDFSDALYYESQFIWLANISKCYRKLKQYNKAEKFRLKYLNKARNHNLMKREHRALIGLLVISLSSRNPKKFTAIKEQIIQFEIERMGFTKVELEPIKIFLNELYLYIDCQSKEFEKNAEVFRRENIENLENKNIIKLFDDIVKTLRE